MQRQLATDGYPTVWFNPWKYEAGRSLWAAFALALERQLAQRYGKCDRIMMWCETVLRRLTLREWFLLGGRVSFWLALIALLVWAAKKGVLAPETKKEDLWGLLKSYSPGVGALAAAWAFLSDMTKQLGSPLKLDMDHLISGAARTVPPDELHRFHQDFRRLLRAYLPPPNPGQPARRTVIVFIDDLDRCEAPKAADLLQSLHLLMDLEEDEKPPLQTSTTDGPQPGLIYILGMDREKVAAAVAAKHEKLLDLLYDPPTGQTKITRTQKMSFGHEFLEKFINLTLHLPAMQGRDLEDFTKQITGWIEPSRDKSPSGPPDTGNSGPSVSGNTFHDGTVSHAPSGPPERAPYSESSGEFLERIENQKRAQRIRTVEQVLDAANVLQPWARSVAPVLENNPRKLKQFVNLLRLRLYLAASANLLDIEGSKDDQLTVHHLAKLVALELADPGAMFTVREQGGTYSALKAVFALNALALALIDKDSSIPGHNLAKANLNGYFHSIAVEAIAAPAAPAA